MICVGRTQTEGFFEGSVFWYRGLFEGRVPLAIKFNRMPFWGNSQVDSLRNVASWSVISLISVGSLRGDTPGGLIAYALKCRYVHVKTNRWPSDANARLQSRRAIFVKNKFRNFKFLITYYLNHIDHFIFFKKSNIIKNLFNFHNRTIMFKTRKFNDRFIRSTMEVWTKINLKTLYVSDSFSGEKNIEIIFWITATKVTYTHLFNCVISPPFISEVPVWSYYQHIGT